MSLRADMFVNMSNDVLKAKLTLRERAEILYDILTDMDMSDDYDLPDVEDAEGRMMWGGADYEKLEDELKNY